MAWKLSSTEPEKRTLYGALNALQLVGLGAKLPAKTLNELNEFVARERSAADDFWGQAEKGNVALTRALQHDTLGADVDAIAGEYRRAFATRSLPHERDSVVDHIAELAALAEGTTADDLRRLAGMLAAG